jgi:tetratricopeptide (TPR) repeat protein
MSVQRRSPAGIVLATCLLAADSVVCAQATSSPPPDMTLVYIERFRSAPLGEDIAQFAQQFIRFELARLPQIVPVTATTAPACRIARAFEQKPGSPKGRDIFSIRGSVDPAADSSYVLDVEVTRCADGVTSLLLHKSRLLRGRSASSDLQSFAATVSDAIRRGALPAVAVSILQPRGAPTPQVPAPVLALRDLIIAAIDESGTAQPVDSGQAVFTVTVEPQKGSREPASVHVRFDGRGRTDSINVERTQTGATSYEQFIARVATRTANALASFMRSADLRYAGPVSSESRDTIIARARAALCFGASSGCRPAPSDALVALNAPIRGAESDVDLLALRGRADLLLGQDGRLSQLNVALGELQRADSIRAASPTVRRIVEASELNLRMAIGDVYRAAGNQGGAAREYERLIALAPNDSAIPLLLAQSYRLAGRRLDALDVATKALLRFPGSGALREDASAGVLDIPFELAADSLPRVAAACRRDPHVKRECVKSLADHGEFATLEGESPARVREVLGAASALAREVLVLAPSAVSSFDSASASRVAVAQALAYIGRPTIASTDGVLAFQSDGFQRDSVTKFLQRARDIGGPLSDTTRGRLSRVRAYYLGLTGNYPQAFSEVEQAYRTIPNREDAVLATQFAMVLSSRAMASRTDSAWRADARQWTESIRDRARGLIDSAAHRFPDDEAVFRARASFCSDFAVDLRCSFETDSLRLARGMLRTSLDILEAVEAAVLTDRNATALDWLKRVPAADMHSCTLAVAELYEFWAAAGTSDPRMATAFNRWSAGIEELRRSSGWQCWVYEGAKERLRQLPRVAQQATLMAMILAYEDRSKPLPKWP